MPSEMELQQHYTLLWKKGQPKVTYFYLGDLENGVLHTLLGCGISLILKCLLWNCNLLLEMWRSALNEIGNGNKTQKKEGLGNTTTVWAVWSVLNSGWAARDVL